VGHALVFDVRSQDLGGFVEIVRPEAVQRTLQEGIDLRALWNHNTDIVLGRVSAGTLRATRDGTGLAVDIWPGPEQRAFVASVSERGVTQMSFGFRTLDDAWHLEDELPIRELLDVRISEVSPVTFPAYLQTDLRVESGPRAWKPSLAFRERQIQAGAR
jgi:HK97 family phage prohead protease